MRKRILLTLVGVPVAAMLALACGGGGGDDGGASPTDLVARKAVPASFAGDDPAWSKATVTSVDTSGVRGASQKTPITVKVQALYSESTVWFRFEWADQTESAGRLWEYDGTQWKSAGNEDRLALYWDMTTIGQFSESGCATLCHNPRAEAIEKWYMITPDAAARADNWHWKAARTNPTGQADDKYLTGTLTDPNDVESANKSDAKESGGYVDNKAKDAAAPAMMLDPAKKASLGSPFILVSEATNIDISRMKAGDKLPRELLAAFKGSRGDIEAKGVWSNGRWVVVLRRALNTGHEDDVSFQVGKAYPFGLAVFDNAGGVNHTISEGALTLKFK